ncbi:MAG: two-component sensor histidine kinase [Prevotellaceae bacterium]|jgi:signal transduction histidine kinase|nr:two-component sensor histidine kinase [Prevotellaceae bacterium]
MKLSYKQRLTVSFCIILAGFTAGTAAFEQYRERAYKTEALEEKLDACAGVAHRYITGQPATGAENVLPLLPPAIRFTWIDLQGQVLFDNQLAQATPPDNHAGRPEILKAARDGKGSDIRTSTSNNREYLYYARRFDRYYIRMALPCDIHVRHFLKPGNAFLYYILALFGIGLLFINYVAGRFGKSVRQLRDFSLAAGSDPAGAVEDMHFPDDELGDIGAKIVHDYAQLKAQERKIALEKEKLLQHVQHSAEGICFFTAGRNVAFHNALFLQYLNMLDEETTTDPARILDNKLFAAAAEPSGGGDSRHTAEMQIDRHGKCFLLRVNRFDDNSFEVVLNDITRSEKTRRLKQELTGNIAHELRTPVTSIRGYLETILEQQLTTEKERQFIQKAYRQTLLLSELIRDMNLLVKLKETSGSFALKPVAVADIIKMAADDMAALLEAQDITVETDVPQEARVFGNENLLYAVFRNLMENVVHHAGKQVRIIITQYAADSDFLHFSFADTGAGIADQRHLPRLFERFYRVTEGRTRDTGGTGLGLAIVKNIILFHRGTVTVKNRAGGGLQFLFSLPEAKN